MTTGIVAEDPSETDPSLNASLAMYTFPDLIAEISILKAGARGISNVESWERLKQVAEDFAQGLPSEGVDVIEDQPWSLVQISIHGHMGILNDTPLVIDFDPRPGITVLHGANGAGKSSISDAIETLLFRKPPLQEVAATGTTPLWNSISIGRDFDETNVEMTLLSGTNKKLYLSCTLHRVSGLISYKFEMEGTDNLRFPISIDSSWDYALRNHCPIFAYANLERNVVTNKDLAIYFEKLLALGGCFIALEDAINARSSAADAALDTWKRAKQHALLEIKEIDGRRRTGTETDLEEVSEPGISDVIDIWLASNSLSESGELSGVVPSNALQTIQEIASNVLGATNRLSEISHSTLEKLAHPLKSLLKEVEDLTIASPFCPVCLMENEDWLRSLKRTVIDFQRFDTQTNETREAISALKNEIQTSLNPIVSLVLPPESDSDLSLSKGECVTLVGIFESSATSAGFALNNSLLSSARNLANWLLTDGSQRLIAYSIEQTHLLRQWKVERSQTAAPFVEKWRDLQTIATDAGDWEATKKRVNDLRNRLRNQRTETLQTRVSDRVNYLLNDVGLSISNLSVQTTKANLTLNDSEGNLLKLGMLSAGQRNAVLLAPIFASMGEGPFSFLVLDDPVHAFDEMRIDRLAQVITELALDKRVVVLTHDERLRQHLLAGSEKCESRLITRSTSNGAVHVKDSGRLWRRLLSDAEIILTMGRPIEGALMSVTDTVRGLCRQSVDNALTDFVTKNAIATGRDYAMDIEKLERELTTSDRFDVAIELCEGTAEVTNRARDAKNDCYRFLIGWNQASHGNPEESEVAIEEIEAAQSACALLTEWTISA